jgi:4-hydroxy-tetrahydrodipicolinate reductase
MGKIVEQIALSRNHTINEIVDSSTYPGKRIGEIQDVDVAIEFTNPDSAVQNIIDCFKAGIPVVSGSTGWYNNLDIIETECNLHNGTLFYASNFSLGVNVFYELNRKLAQIMNSFKEYEVELIEIHHNQKLDSPSGTAITLANDIIHNLENKNSWVNNKDSEKGEIKITSKRIDNIPGTHTISYESAVDRIEISHTAKNRNGFGLGSVIAAEFIVNKKGIYNMQDLLKL